MQGTSKYLFLPLFIGTVVLLIALTLLAIVAFGPYTHANLDTGYDPGYTRTNQTLIGAPIPYSGEGIAGPSSNDPIRQGKQLFVTKGCATCHGLDGHGGIIGPSIVGTTAKKLRVRTTVGPRGMPAYAPGALTDNDLAAIAAYLKSMSK
ncbi:MAG: cytochrome c [Anaerolineales bacterium]|jgi:mono/diheme cytochrome c family protein